MARDKTGFMSVDVTRTVDPAAPNAQLLGKAAEIKGQAAGEAIKFLGTTALQAGIGWKEAEQQKAIVDTIERTYNPETGYIGAKAKAAKEAQSKLPVEEAYNSGLWGAAGNAGEFSPELIAELNRSNDTIRNIKEAADQQVLSPEQARTEIASHIRKSIATFPGLADQFRKQASELMHGVDVYETERLLAQSNRESAADRAAKEMEKATWDMAKDIWGTGGGNPYGVTDLNAIYMHIKNDTEQGSRMKADITAERFGKTAIDRRKTRTANDMDGWFADTQQAVMSNIYKVQTDSSKRLEAAGINVASTNVASLSAQQLELLNRERATVTANISSLVQNEMMAYDAHLAANKGQVSMEVADSYRKRLEGLRDSMIKSVGSTPESFLEANKGYLVAAGQTLTNLVQAQQAQESMIKIAFGSTFLEAAKNPSAMKGLRQLYKDNQAAQAMLDEIENLQKGLPTSVSRIREFNRAQYIADGMFNPAASPTSKAALEEAQAAAASGDKAAVQAIADATQLAKDEGKNVLKNGVGTDRDAVNAFAFAQRFLLNTDLDEMHRLITSGSYEDKFRNNTQNIKPFVDSVGARAERWLSGSQAGSLPKQIAEASTNLPENIIISVENGRAVLRSKTGGRPYAEGSMHTVAKVDGLLERANKLIDIQEKLGVDRQQRVAQFVGDLSNEDVPKPLLERILSLSSDYLKTATPAKKVSVDDASKPKSIDIYTKEDALKYLSEGKITGAQYDAIVKDMGKK